MGSTAHNETNSKLPGKLFFNMKSNMKSKPSPSSRKKAAAAGKQTSSRNADRGGTRATFRKLAVLLRELQPK